MIDALKDKSAALAAALLFALTAAYAGAAHRVLAPDAVALCLPDAAGAPAPVAQSCEACRLADAPGLDFCPTPLDALRVEREARSATMEPVRRSAWRGGALMARAPPAG